MAVHRHICLLASPCFHLPPKLPPSDTPFSASTSEAAGNKDPCGQIRVASFFVGDWGTLAHRAGAMTQTCCTCINFSGLTSSKLFTNVVSPHPSKRHTGETSLSDDARGVTDWRLTIFDLDSCTAIIQYTRIDGRSFINSTTWFYE